MLSTLARLGLLGTLVGGSTIALVGGERAKLYFESGKEAVLSAIDEAQGMESKLRLIRTQINSLDSEEKRIKTDAIRNNVEVDALRKDIEKRESSLARQAALLQKVSGMLGDGSVQYVIAGRAYDRSAIESDAAEKLAIYNVQKETLASLKETLATKEKAVEIAATNVSRAASLRTDLRAQVALLEAKLEKFRAKQDFAATVDEVVDTDQIDSALTRAKAMIQDFSKDLEVKDRMLDEQLKVSKTDKASGINYDSDGTAAQDIAAKIRVAIGEAAPNAAHANDAVSFSVTVH